MAISDAQFLAWLQQDSTSRVLLVEATYYSAGSEHTVYLSNGIYISQTTDIPASMPYDDAVLDIPQFQSQLSDALEGFTVPSWGSITISNELFDKDAWLDYAWDGRRVNLLFGDKSWAKTDFRTVLSGTISELSADSNSTLKMDIRDKQWMLNVPIQTRLIGEPVLVSGTTYKVSDSAVTSIDSVWDAGTLLTPTTQYTTNIASGQFTLVAAAVGRVTAAFSDTTTQSKGANIPLCYGQCFNVSPIMINSSLLKYQVHDGAISAISAVRDNGVPVTFTADLTTGTFTLAAMPVGKVTADVNGATSAGVYLVKTGDIINYIVTTKTALTTSDIDSVSLTAFLTSCPQTVGLYIPDRKNVIDVLDEFIASVGSWYTFNRQGKLIFGRMDIPAGTPAAYLVPDDVVFGGLSVKSQSLPVMTKRLTYSTNYTQQTNIAGSVATTEATTYYQPNKTVSANNQAVKTAHLLATEPDVKNTLLISQTDAQTEANRLLSLWGSQRRTYQVECIIAPLVLNLGDVINLQHPRYGLAAGVLLKVIGISEIITKRRVTLTLWG